MKHDDPKYKTHAILSLADHNPAILFQLEHLGESGFRLNYACEQITWRTGLTTDEIRHGPSKIANLVDDSEKRE